MKPTRVALSAKSLRKQIEALALEAS